TSSQYAAFSIYQRSGSSWIPQADLQQSPSSANAPIDLSADGTTAIIGDFISNNYTGCVKVFSFSNNSWSQQTTLFASDSDSGDSFGSSVSISADGNTVAIGAPGHDTQNNPDQGAIYVFTRSNTNWSQSAELNYPNNNTSYQKFGASVSISADGNTILATDAQVQNYPFSTQNHTGVIFSKIANQWIPQANFPIPVSTYGYISDSAISTDGSTIAFAIPNLILSGITNSTLPNSVFSLSWAQSIASVQVQVGFQPTPIILGIFSDTGTSFSDGITNDNTISLNGVSTPGYTVDLYLGSQLRGTAPVDNSGLWFFDYSSTPLPDGLHSFTARANGPNNFSSAFSQPFHVTVDTIQPTASLESIQTPRNSPVASININFSEPVTGLDINDLTLSRNGSVINLQGASISGSGSAYSLSGISILT
ncbi:MAG: Ig-like domain-containing protein, partial [Planctomycetia bacterium]